MVCGIDEAGRGSLAGPVCAATVIINDDFPIHILDDSKKLSVKLRTAAAQIIKNQSVAWGIGWASHLEIDKINILNASLLAMRRSFYSLYGNIDKKKKDFITWYTSSIKETIIDGLYVPKLPISSTAIVRADGLYPAVMAASIIAKTERDSKMSKLALLYPEYKYEKHKGYPTKEHRRILSAIGPSPIQRLTFNYGV